MLGVGGDQMERKFTDVCGKQSYGTLRTMQSEYRKVFYVRPSFICMLRNLVTSSCKYANALLELIVIIIVR